MAVDLDKLKWALSDLTEVVDELDLNGVPTGNTVGVNNKEEPTAQVKDSGLKFEEPLPRANYNFMLNQIYLAFVDLETRVAALEP